MTSRAGVSALLDHADLVVVGAGIVGLAHAVRAVEYGLSVVVIERDEFATGASVRNFGHGCITAQAGDALRYATKARDTWTRLAKLADFWMRESGTVVVARSADEMTVLEDLRAERHDDVVLLDAAAVGARVPVGDGVSGGAWLPRDIRIDPRTAVPAITSWLAGQGVRFHFVTALLGVDDSGVTTTRGRVGASRVVVAVGHDVDRVFPDIAAQARMTRCALHMLRIAVPQRGTIDPAVLTGWSMLRYPAFEVSPALTAVRTALAAECPAGIEHGLNLMFTQRPDGDLTVGDTHTYADTASPFQDEALDEIVLAQISTLLGAGRPVIRERWQGVYASAPDPFLIARPSAALRVVSVTSGVGMTTAFGLAAEVVDDLLAQR